MSNNYCEKHEFKFITSECPYCMKDLIAELAAELAEAKYDANMEYESELKQKDKRIAELEKELTEATNKIAEFIHGENEGLVDGLQSELKRKDAELAEANKSHQEYIGWAQHKLQWKQVCLDEARAKNKRLSERIEAIADLLNNRFNDPKVLLRYIAQQVDMAQNPDVRYPDTSLNKEQ